MTSAATSTTVLNLSSVFVYKSVLLFIYLRDRERGERGERERGEREREERKRERQTERHREKKKERER